MGIPADRWESVLTAWVAEGGVEVVANDEFALGDLARVRHFLGLERVTPRLLDRYLDKAVMKAALQTAGIAVPTWYPLPSPLGEATVPKELAFPCVVKPRVGSNSRGVRVIRTVDEWKSWVDAHADEKGWEIEEFIDAPMCFVDGLVTDGHYQPVLVGQYLGGLLPSPETSVFGAIDVSENSSLYHLAVALGEQVASALGTDGRFATHLEFFNTGEEPTVTEVSARAPGALVSEMARVVSGHNLESAHLQIQAGGPAPQFRRSGKHAAWLSCLSRPGQRFLGPPPLSSSAITIHHLSAPSGRTGRSVSAMILLANDDHDALADDLTACANNVWYAQT